MNGQLVVGSSNAQAATNITATKGKPQPQPAECWGRISYRGTQHCPYYHLVHFQGRGVETFSNTTLLRRCRLKPADTKLWSGV